MGATLDTLLKFLNWIPLGYIFETKLIQTLIFKASQLVNQECGKRRSAYIPPSGTPIWWFLLQFFSLLFFLSIFNLWYRCVSKFIEFGSGSRVMTILSIFFCQLSLLMMNFVFNLTPFNCMDPYSEYGSNLDPYPERCLMCIPVFSSFVPVPYLCRHYWCRIQSW